MSGSALERLVELSVCKKARLDSDSTLVAVITAVSESDRDDVTYIVPGRPQARFTWPAFIINTSIFYARAQPAFINHSALTVIQQCLSGSEDFSVSEYFNNSGQTWSFRAAGLLSSQLLQDIFNKTREFCMTGPYFFYSLLHITI